MKFGWHDPHYTLLQGKINYRQIGDQIFEFYSKKEIQIDFTIASIRNFVFEIRLLIYPHNSP
jgi:hypothetical protein